MTDDEKVLIINSRMYMLDNMITELGHENKTDEEAKAYTDLVLRKKALFSLAQSLDDTLQDSLENQG